MGVRKRAFRGVFIEENAHRSRSPCLHLQGKWSISPHPAAKGRGDVHQRTQGKAGGAAPRKIVHARLRHAALPGGFGWRPAALLQDCGHLAHQVHARPQVGCLGGVSAIASQTRAYLAGFFIGVSPQAAGISSSPGPDRAGTWPASSSGRHGEHRPRPPGAPCRSRAAALGVGCGLPAACLTAGISPGYGAPAQAENSSPPLQGAA